MVAGVVLVAALTALTGCQPAAPSSAGKLASNALSTIVKPIWTVSVRGVSSKPIVVDSTAVTYVTSNGSDLLLTGYDIKSGKKLWQRNSSTGNVYPDTLLSVSVTQDASGNPLLVDVTPPVLQSDNAYAHTVVLVDPRTGRTVAESPRLWVASANGCNGSRGACFWAWDNARQTNIPYRLDPDSQATEQVTDTLPGYESVRSFGSGVYAARKDGQESLIRVVNGATSWSAPTSEILGRPGAFIGSLGGSKAFPDKKVLLLSSSGIPTTDGPPEYTAAQFVTLGLDIGSGKVLWRKNNVVGCSLPSGVVCSGDASYSGDSAKDQWVLKTHATTLTGLDPRTGKERWSTKSADLGGLGSGSNQTGSLLSPPGTLVFTDAGKAKVVDLATGKVRPLAKNDLTGCTAQASITAPEWSNPYKSPVSFTGGRVQQGCGVGQPMSDPSRFTAAVVSTADDKWYVFNRPSKAPDGFHVVQTTDRLLGYTLDGEQ